MEEVKIDHNIKSIPTIKEFLNNTYKYELLANIVDVQLSEQNQQILKVLCDQTIFHPQGGGQPSDEGNLIIQGSEQKCIQVQSIEYDKHKEQIWHLVLQQFQPIIKIGEKILLQINKEKRITNAKLHSGGHLLDIAVKHQNLQWKPGKGYHFEQGSYVEYLGEIKPEQNEELKKQLNLECEKILNSTQKDDNVKIINYEYDEGQKVVDVPDYLPVGKPFRYVTLNNDDKGCPCGGTHVQHISHIGKVIVTKIQKKSKNVRVFYSIQGGLN